MSDGSRDHSSRNNSGIKDIGLFVENYKSLLDKLFPVFVVWDSVLYISRWENYLLTLTLILVFTILFYYPAIFFSLLTLSAILFMGVGRYHGQIKAIIAFRKHPSVELLDPDQPALKKQHSEQGHMHKSRLEFRQILSNAERFILKADKVVDYAYGVYLWKSPEVSLCVTVLLCLLLVLLCTVDVHNIGASLPAIVLCTNRHFFSRSIDLWKQLLTRLRQKLDKRKKRQASAKHYSHDDLEKDGPGQEREMTATLVEHTSTQLPQEHNSESGQIETVLSPELRHRTGTTHSSTDQTSTSTASSATGRGSVEIVVTTTGETVSESETPVLGSTEGGTIQKDGKSTQQELCGKCQTSFFLKRKHDCNLCGQTFCGSCTVKVKKAALGVTSPTTYETIVRVCFNCKAQLDDYTCTKE